jgi:hypothetical protein
MQRRTIVSRKASKAPRQYLYVVEGTGVFPRDMLRYDNSTPATEADKEIVEASYQNELLWDGVTLRKNKVKLSVPYGTTLTPARWKSFKWPIVDEPTLKV